MPTVAEYPNPFSTTLGVTGPYWKDFLFEGPTFKTNIGPVYEDGGRDRNIEGSTDPTHVTLKWTIEYEGLHEDEQAVLDNHFNSACGQGYSFNLYDHRQGILFSGVYYESYKRDKGKHRRQGKRKVLLVKDPS